MKVGDVVVCYRTTSTGVVVSFNEKGEGGKDFVHVLQSDGKIYVYMNFDLQVIENRNKE